MTTLFFSKIFIVFLTLFIIAIDIFLARNNIKGDTFSEVITNWSLRLPIVAYGFGILGGHWFGLNNWFHPFKSVDSAVLLGWTGIVVVMIGLICDKMGFSIPPLLMVFLGLAAGWLLWSR